MALSSGLGGMACMYECDSGRSERSVLFKFEHEHCFSLDRALITDTATGVDHQFWCTRKAFTMTTASIVRLTILAQGIGEYVESTYDSMSGIGVRDAIC
jgi:hypothetical protein